jgi:predicted DNA-binding transcriptional regulator
MGKAQKPALIGFIKKLQIGPTKLRIYEQLSSKPMTIKQLQKSTRMSERMLRICLDDMLRRGFIRKQILEDKHMKYLYLSNSPDTVFDSIIKHMESREKVRKRMKKAILNGMNK